MSETVEKIRKNEAREAQKPYTFRKLCAKDVFLMTAIIKKIGLGEFRAFFEGEGMSRLMSAFSEKNEKNEASSIEAIGISVAIELADIIFGNLQKCEEDIFSLLGEVAQMDISDVKALDIASFAEMIIDFFKKDDFKDFFKVVSKSFR